MNYLFFKINKENIGSIFFYLGILSLPSAFSISILFLTISLFIRILEKSFKEIYQDKWNYPLLVLSILMLISCLSSNNLIKEIHIYNIPFEFFKDWKPSLAWLDLINWIPMYLIFIYFQKYLNTIEQRKKVAKLFLISTIPVLISGFSQIWFNIFGPFEALNGLIIWYQREHEKLVFTAMFNNQNYTGTWLNIVYPFSLAVIFERNLRNFKRLILFFLTILIMIATYETSSRNAWIGNILSSVSLINKNLLILYFIILIIILLLLLLARFNIFPSTQEYIRKLIPSKFWNEENLITLTNINDIPRFEIWIKSINFIIKRPFLGWGAGSFPLLYEFEKTLIDNNYTEQVKQHSHNLYLLLAINYGIITSLIFISFLIILICSAYAKYNEKVSTYHIKKRDLIFDKAWMISLIILLISQLFDVQYYDGRLSISLWILLAGIRRF